MCEIRPQKDFGPIMLSLRKESVTMCHFGPDLSPFFTRRCIYPFFLAHPIVRFADSLQKKGDYSHQTSKKINAIQYNE